MPAPSANRRPPLWLAAILYTALTIVLAYPLSIHPAGYVMSEAPDTDYSLWALSWDTHALIHQPFAVFDANIYYPESRTLAYSENLLGSAPFAAPIIWITHNPVLAMNLVVLAACVLCGIGACRLASQLGIGAAGAILCGAVFAFAPPRFLRLDQFHLATMEWIPFSLASLHQYFDSMRRRDLVLASSFFTLQALSSGHGAVFLIVALAIVVLCRLLLKGVPLRAGDLATAGVCVIPALLALWPYRIVQLEMGLRRSLEDWAVPWRSFLASSTHADAFLWSLVPSWRIDDVAGPHLFPGVLPLVLAAASLTWARRHREMTWTAAAAGVLETLALAAVAAGVYITATGTTRIRLGGVTVATIRQAWRVWVFAGAAIGLRALIGSRRMQLASTARTARAAFLRWRSAHADDPRVAYGAIVIVSLWLAAGEPISLWPAVYWLPGLNFIRAPSRFTILTVLGLAVLAGIGFERLTSRLGARARTIAAAVVLALLVVEFSATPFELEAYSVETPPIERWLAQQTGPLVIAEVPVGNPRNYGQWERREATFMLHATAHWQKTVHGYSGFRPERHQQLFAELAEFPSEQSLQHLHELGVTDLVVHTDLYPPGDWPVIEQRMAAFGGRLTLRHVEGDGRVYALERAR
jgi:hypothetical protein